LPQRLTSKPTLLVLRWQLLVTAVISLIVGLIAGADGALSAWLGGTVMMVAGCVYSAMAGSNKVRSAAEILRTLIRAETGKIGVIVLQLWLVLTVYEAVMPAVFISTFIVAVLIYPLALLVRE